MSGTFCEELALWALCKKRQQTLISRTVLADGAHTRIEWVELGGPPIESQRESGFGSLLIQSSVSHDLGGTVDMQFEPQGLHCTITFPLAHSNE